MREKRKGLGASRLNSMKTIEQQFLDLNLKVDT